MTTTTLRSAEALADVGLLQRERLPTLAEVAARYAVAVTPALAELIDRGDPADPIGDQAHSPVAGVVHRYPDRVLLKVTHTCAVYCRFCFRREMVGPGKAKVLTAAQLDAALAYIEGHPAIWEVILTGGDPLMLSPRRLGALMARLARIEHVKVVRYHTRIPVADPAMITPALVAAMKSPTQATYVALHANHPRELTGAARAACAAIIDAGMPMLSQTVLLAGVNDDAAVLGQLMRAFVETRIKPYYLHHGDLAPGTAHFRASLETGQALMRRLRGDLSGLAQPTYMLDLPGGHGKVPVGPGYVAGDLDACVSVEDPWGRVHAYPPG